MRNKTKRLLLILALAAFFAACAKKKKADDFQNFGGISYNAAPKTLSATLGLNIAVQAMDINFDGKMDGLYVCRTGGVKQFTLDAAGAGYTNSPLVTIQVVGGTCGTAPEAISVVANGRVERIVITNPGDTCTTNSFNVTIAPPGAGSQASAQVTGASSGKLTRISMLQKGSGYAAPAVTITGGGGSGAGAGVNVQGGTVQGVYLLELGDGRYSTAPAVTLTGDTGTGAAASVATADVIVSELDANGACSVTYDPTNVVASLRHIPQMMFTWPVTPTIGLDVNGDTNADYYLYTNADGSSQVMTNSDGSGAVAKLIVKNPMIDETNDLLYSVLNPGQVIGFDVLNNNTIANNILGKIALDRANLGYVDAGDPMAIISPIRNGEFYAAPMDVNILCSDRVACNAIAYSLFKSGEVGPHNNPDFSNTNLDPTGVDYTGPLHAIKPGDSGTISFQNLPFGNYFLKYLVRDAAGRTSGVQTISFTIGRKPDISIMQVTNRYVSQFAGSPASFQWTADTGSLTKPFRYLIAVNGSCIGYTRAQYISPPAGVVTGGPFASGTPVTTPLPATATGMLFDDIGHGINYITICAITCEVAACNLATHLSVWGDAFETVIRDDTAPSITASPLSGMYDRPQQIFLSGSTTVGGVPANGSLTPSEICYTWGADAAGNPQAGQLPADPAFPCAAANNVVQATGASTQLNLGCNTRASVTDPVANLATCAFTPGIYYLKFRARDAAGNLTAIQTQAYAVGVTPQITTNQAPHPHLWSANAGWGNNGDATLPAPVLTAGQTLRAQTTWTWQTDFPGTYQVRINDGTLDCTGGTLSTHASATGTVVALSPLTVTILAADLNVDINTVKVCYWPSGGGAVNSASQQIWRLTPVNFNTIADVGVQNVARFNVGDNLDVALSDLYTPVSAIQSITFTCPAGSTGVDANDGCTQPTAMGSVVRPGVNTIYRLPALPANRVTTIAYDVRITVCNISSCSAAAGPTFGTESAAPYSGGATVKVFVMQDKTAGNSIYVDNVTGNDTNPGTVRSAPKRSLSSAAAAATSGKAIYVIGGTYCGNGAPPCSATTGTLNLLTGSSLYGGFTSAWYRPDVASNRANITAGSNDSAHSTGISVGAVNVPVFIEGINLTTQRAVPDLVSGYNTVGVRATSGTSTLTLYKNTVAADGATAGSGPNPGSTYGIHVTNVGVLVLQQNAVTAGPGWHGANGGLGGTAGNTGGNGGNGNGGSCDGGCPIFGCGGCQLGGIGGGGGTSPIGNTGGSGGRGGAEDSCVGSGDGANGTIGLPSTALGNGGGSGNPGGQGVDGTGGSSGSNGSGGNGGSGGSVASGFWVGGQGGGGTNGTNGTGGGGGGGGGAQWSGTADNGPGNGGGGGGGAGSAGSGGEGGHAGGASVALFLHTTQASLSGNTLVSGNGGSAGDGKLGGSAGPGGSGGNGGANCTGEIRRGGNGGAGGAGGNGGRGGGGEGGPSIGISLYSATLTSCSANSLTPGSGGSGGAGANNGANGFAATCYDFNLPGNCTCP